MEEGRAPGLELFDAVVAGVYTTTTRNSRKLVSTPVEIDNCHRRHGSIRFARGQQEMGPLRASNQHAIPQATSDR